MRFKDWYNKRKETDGKEIKEKSCNNATILLSCDCKIFDITYSLHQ